MIKFNIVLLLLFANMQLYGQVSVDHISMENKNIRVESANTMLYGGSAMVSGKGTRLVATPFKVYVWTRTTEADIYYLIERESDNLAASTTEPRSDHASYEHMLPWNDDLLFAGFEYDDKTNKLGIVIKAYSGSTLEPILPKTYLAEYEIDNIDPFSDLTDILFSPDSSHLLITIRNVRDSDDSNLLLGTSIDLNYGKVWDNRYRLGKDEYVHDIFLSNDGSATFFTSDGSIHFADQEISSKKLEQIGTMRAQGAILKNIDGRLTLISMVHERSKYSLLLSDIDPQARNVGNVVLLPLALKFKHGINNLIFCPSDDGGFYLAGTARFNSYWAYSTFELMLLKVDHERQMGWSMVVPKVMSTPFGRQDEVMLRESNGSLLIAYEEEDKNIELLAKGKPTKAPPRGKVNKDPYDAALMNVDPSGKTTVRRMSLDGVTCRWEYLQWLPNGELFCGCSNRGDDRGVSYWEFE
jgi:hypothetical protein